MAENGGLTSMKSKFLITIIPALMVLSACSGAGLKKEAVQLEPEFVEDTLAHEEIFGEGGQAIKLNPYKDPDPSDPSLKKPVVGVQYKDDGDGKFAIRYVAAIAALDVEAHWTRGICNKNGVQQKTPNNMYVDKVVTTAYTAVSADAGSGASFTTPETVDSDFHYFVVYTLREVPAEHVDSYLFAFLTLEKGGNSVSSKAIISKIDGGNSFAYDLNGETNYFIQGTIGGAENQIAALNDPQTDGNLAQKSGLSLAANDNFGLFKVAPDHFQCFGYHQLKRGAPFLPRVAASNYIKASAAGEYNIFLTGSNEIHIVVPESAKASATYYLKPNANWASNGARFAAYFFNNSESINEWVDMVPVADGFYSVDKPVGKNYVNVIFLRMNPSNLENRWNVSEEEPNKPVWNQTGDLGLDESGNTYFINDESWTEGNWNLHVA